jgi:hypothetical protein
MAYVMRFHQKMAKCLQSSVAGLELVTFESLPMLIQLLYSSKATTALSPAELTAILDKSVANNRPPVTGLLLTAMVVSCSCWKGRRPWWRRLSRISQDPRHHQVESLFSTNATARVCQWYMGSTAARSAGAFPSLPRCSIRHLMSASWCCAAGWPGHAQGFCRVAGLSAPVVVAVAMKKPAQAALCGFSVSGKASVDA